MTTTLHTSAGVYFEEVNDRSVQAALLTGGIATLVMPAPRGVVGQNMKILASEFESLMGSKSGKYWQNVEILRLLSKQANYINFTRVGKDVKHALTMITTYNNMSVSRPVTEGIDDLNVIVFGQKDILAAVGRHGGDNGNEYYIAYEPDLTNREVNAFNLYVYAVGSKTPIKEFKGATLFYHVDDDNRQCHIEELVNNDRTCPIMVFVNNAHYKLATDKEYAAINTIGGGAYNPNSPTTPHGQLLGGDDGMDIDVYSDDEAVRNASLALILEGWDNYSDWETSRVGIACDGGYAHPAIASKIDELMESRNDCIGNNNVPVQWQDYTSAVAYRHGYNKIDGMEFALSSSFSTLGTNDVWMTATAVQRGMWVPYSVALTYIMLECDKTRSWLAPAGLNRGGLPWGERLRYDFEVDKRDILNDNQINFPIHFKTAMTANDALGIFGWNADTLYGKGSALDDIGVRRLLAVLTDSTRAQFLWYNFEGNDAVLRKELETNLRKNILQPAKDGRGLDWFDVVVDSRNNSNQIVANGDLVVDVYLDPTRYTKRIHLNLNVAPTGEIKAVVSLIENGQV